MATRATTRVRRTVSIAEPLPLPVRPVHDHDKDWAILMASVQNAYNRAVVRGNGHMFQTDASNLFQTFLFHIPEYEKQIHNCRTCRRFLEAFGGLVRIDEHGVTHPVMWDATVVPEFYRPAVAAVAGYVERARVTGVFLSDERVWGWPEHGGWTHLSAVRQQTEVFHTFTQNPNQAMAEKAENFKNITRALVEFPAAILKEALRILEADAVNRAERFVAPVKWLLDLHEQRSPHGRYQNKIRVANYQWRQIASAPDGFCHPRASVIGSLLEDITARLPFERVRARFNEKVHGLNFQRAHAAPTAGNIAAAEKLIQKMGIARSLERRFARLTDLELLWSPRLPRSAPVAAGGVFGHLTPKNGRAAALAPALALPRQAMTWDKFSRTVLPSAEALELLMPQYGAFTAFLTAANPDAPLIFKWPNPVTSYLYHHEPAKGHYAPVAAHWRLAVGSWTKITGVALRANMWGNNPQPHLGTGAVLILDGAVDTGRGQGNALFPETLRSELLPVRATIEAYSKTAEISGREAASACGLAIGDRGTNGAPIRVTTDGKTVEYIIDRWD